MGINITQPFSFDSIKPNFERDVIDTTDSVRFTVSNGIARLTAAGQSDLSGKYNDGHIMWDVNTRRNYRFLSSVSGSSTVYAIVPVEPVALQKTEWQALSGGVNDYIPKPGEIIIYTDAATKTETIDNVQVTTNIPMFKVGDGVKNAEQLPFMTISKLQGVLTIGPHTYDGSQDVNVNTYTGGGGLWS